MRSKKRGRADMREAAKKRGGADGRETAGKDPVEQMGEGKTERGKIADREKARRLCDQIWQLTVRELSLRFPYLRSLWCRFRFEAEAAREDVAAGAKWQSAFATDGESIRYEEDALLALYGEDPDGVTRLFFHMAMHVLLLHVAGNPPLADENAGLAVAPKQAAVRQEEDGRKWKVCCRSGSAHKEPQLWDIACDLAAERLAGELLEAPREAELSGLDEKELRADKIYKALQERGLSEKEKKSLEGQIRRDSHRLWGQRYSPRELREKLRPALRELARNLGAGSGGLSDVRGAAAGGSRETLFALQRRKISYRDFLERFAISGEELGLDEESFDYIPYLFGLSHYKNMPLIEHLEYREVRKIAELVIAIDTSGSCRTETVRRFMEETYAILSDRRNFFRHMDVYILQCDFCVQQAAHITCEEEWKDYLEHLTIQGRSGTDFRPVFAYVEELRKKRELVDLRGLLYFTDGDGVYPETPTDYDTAFLFYREREGHQRVPDWAYQIRLEEAK